MAAPVIASTATASDSSSQTSRTVAKPSGVASGDHLLMTVHIDGTAAVNTPTGWTFRFSRSTSAGDVSVYVFERIADGSEGATFTVTSDSELCTIIVGRITGGPAGASVIDTISYSGGELGEVAGIRCPNAWADADDSLVLRVATSDASVTQTVPGGHTSVQSGSSGSSGASAHWATQDAAQNAGVVQNASFASGSSFEEYIGLTVVLRSTTTPAAAPDYPYLKCLGAEITAVSTAITLGLPYGTQDDDLLIASRFSDGSNFSNIVSGSGYTNIAAPSEGSIEHRVDYKVASSEAATLTVMSSAATTAYGAVLERWVNVNTTTPIAGSTSGTGSDTAPTSGSFTNTADHATIRWSMACDDDDVASDSGYPSTYTGIFAVSHQEGNDSGYISAFKHDQASGTIAAAAGALDAAEGWAVIAFAIAPAAAGGPTTYTKSASAGALLTRAGLTKTVSAGALLTRAGIGKSASASALLTRGVTKAAAASALLEKLGLPKTAGGNALLLKAGITLTSSAGAVLAAVYQKTASASALLTKSAAKTAAASALLEKLGITKTAGAGALLLKAVVKQAGADALLTKTGVAVSAAANALLLKAGVTWTAGGNALLTKAGIAVSAGCSAVLIAAAAGTQTVTAACSALLLKALTRTAAANAYLVKRLALAALAGAVLQKNGIQRAASAGALLARAGVVKETEVSALLVKTGGLSAQAAALLLKALTRQAALDALLHRQGLALGAACTAILITPLTSQPEGTHYHPPRAAARVVPEDRVVYLPPRNQPHVIH